MPKKILLLRHAEEPDEEDNLDLSAAGRQRAEQLSAYIPRTFGKPRFLFAAAPSSSSVRCYLTLRPLSDRLGLHIDAPYEDRDFTALAAKILADPAFDNALIVVAWTHKQLPALASAMNVSRDDFPGRWNEEAFDLIFELTYKKRPRPKVRRIKQPF